MHRRRREILDHRDGFADGFAEHWDGTNWAFQPIGLTQPTVSHHLKILVNAGIFTRDQRGVWAYYALVPAALDAPFAVPSTAR